MVGIYRSGSSCLLIRGPLSIDDPGSYWVVQIVNRAYEYCSLRGKMMCFPMNMDDRHNRTRSMAACMKHEDRRILPQTYINCSSILQICACHGEEKIPSSTKARSVQSLTSIMNFRVDS